MVNEADMVGLTDEQARRFQDIDDAVSQTREGIAVWHRLLDRRRLDRKRGVHPIAEFAVDRAPHGDAQGTLVRRDDPPAEAAAREPFYVSYEAEARALLLRCVGYLSNQAGDKLAFDKGAGGRDKMAEWIALEIKQNGGIAYIRKHRPYVFGIPLAVAS
jgi:hypothetical protein